ncbi:MAG: hypothetical protein HYX73_10435 [Acidobacteria bacterium]|nr:hypothetical protein [Acidobacteriota bacterium]
MKRLGLMLLTTVVILCTGERKGRCLWPVRRVPWTLLRLYFATAATGWRPLQGFPTTKWKGTLILLLAAATIGSLPRTGWTQSSPALTTVRDTVYKSDGTPATGTVVIAWQGFMSADTRAVFGGNKTIPLTNGALAVALVPNVGGTPSGTSYRVRYYQSGGLYFEETWVVPTSSPLASPDPPTVTPQGTTGSTSYCYWISATNANGETLLGSSTCISNGNANLDGTNYNQVAWAAVSGATGYNVYRTPNQNAPSGTGSYRVGSTAGTTIDDQSNSLSAATIPTVNTTDTRTLSDVRVTAAPSPSVQLAAPQVNGTAIVANPSSTQTITAPSSSGIPLQITGRNNNSSNVFEIYDNQATPQLQSYFNQNGDARFKDLNAVRFADQFAGANAGAKIAAAITDLPSTGGTVDARGLEGAQAFSSTLTISKPVVLLLGATTVTFSGSAPCINITSSNVTIRGIRDATTIQNNTNGDCIRANTLNQTSGLVLEDLNITDGVGAGRTSGSGVLVDGTTGAARFAIRRVHVADHQFGFTLANFLLSVLEQCRATSNESHGFNYSASAGGSTTLVSTANYSSSNAGYGYYYAGSMNSLASDADAAESNTLGGVFLDNQNNGIYGSTFNNLALELNAAFGFKALNATNITLISPTVVSTTGSPGHGILFDSVRQGQIIGGISNSNAAYGVKISNTVTTSNTITITGLRAGSNASGRISADGTASYIETNSEETDGDLLSLVATNHTPYLQRWKNATAGVEFGWLITNGGSLELYKVGAGVQVSMVPGSAVTYADRIVSPGLTSTASDPADAGVIRVANDEVAIGAEAAPAGTDGTLKYNSSEQWETNSPLTVTGSVTASKAILSHQEAMTFSATPTFDASLGNSFKMTLTDNVSSSTISNPQTGQFLTLLLCQDGTGSRTMTWPTNLKLAGGTFTLTTTLNKCDSVTAVYDGTNWYEIGRAANL